MKTNNDDWTTGNNIRNEGAKALSELIQMNTSLTSMNLGREEINGRRKEWIDGWMIDNEIKIEGAKLMSETLKTNSTLTTLDMSCSEPKKLNKEITNDGWLTDNDIEIEGAKSLSEMLQANTTLKSLYLGGDDEETENIWQRNDNKWQWKNR